MGFVCDGSSQPVTRVWVHSLALGTINQLGSNTAGKWIDTTTADMMTSGILRVHVPTGATRISPSMPFILLNTST